MGFVLASPIFFAYICSMEREEVYKAIDTEREYQDFVTPIDSRMVDDYAISHAILNIEKFIGEAREAWYGESSEDSYQKTMDMLRKIAGVCVKSGEKYGMPERDRSFEHLEGPTTGKV